MWTIAGFLHAERLKGALARELVERHSRNLLDDLAEKNVADIAVGEFAPRRRDRLQRVKILPGCIDALLIITDRIVGDEAGRVRQQLGDSDPFGHFASERGEMPGDWIVQLQLAVFDEQHDRQSGGDRFRQGREVEDRVLGHQRMLGHGGTFAERLAIDDLVPMQNEDDGARQFLARDGGIHRVVNGREFVAGGDGASKETKRDEAG